ncbi:MAG: zinc ribbon domain-containing protein [Candidatus Omnitrophica bacterium]|nr:zinc ribbon domain-containing protein [Candidatus Omnitrophota bacterium]
MPTYEYECKKCKKTFEVFQPMKDKPLKKCKYCKGPVIRLIGTGGGFIFKGNGFHATDYRSSDYNAKKNKDKAPPSCPAQDGGSCKDCPKGK